jgi:cytochrome P450
MSSAPTAGSVDLSTFNLFDPATQNCPYPHYQAMRETAPVFQVPGTPIWLVTTYDLTLEVIRDWQTYSSNFGATAMPGNQELQERLSAVRKEMGGYKPVSTMLSADPPHQTRYRKLVSKAFTPKAIAALEPVIREISSSLIDAWIDKGSIEFVTGFAVPLPVQVIARALNVPEDRLADFKRWSDDSIAGIGTNITADQRVEAERGIVEFQLYFADQLNQRKAHPQDDLLTNLLNARIEPDDLDDQGNPLDNRELDMPEMLSILQQLLVAGNETTTKMLTEMMRLLAETPGEWDKVRNDPSRVRSIVEETLRLSTPTQGMWRIVTKDVTLGGVDIPKGSRLVVMFSSANRDANVFTDADSFCPERANVGEQLAFGKGTHYCLGANLSRLEGKVALEELAKRLGSISLPASNTFDYHPSFMLRGLTKLDLAFTPASV